MSCSQEQALETYAEQATSRTACVREQDQEQEQDPAGAFPHPDGETAEPVSGRAQHKAASSFPVL